MRVLCGIIVTVLGWCSVGSAQFIELNETQRVVGSTVDSGDSFGGPFFLGSPFFAFEAGTAVAIDGDVMVAGAYGDDRTEFNVGAAYVYRRVGGEWVEEQKLTPSDATGGQNFGSALAIQGDTIMVGSFRADSPGFTNNGQVYVFRYDGASWVEEQILFASDSANDINFGWSLAIDGDVALISADWDFTQGDFAGAVYAFRFDGSIWVEEQKLLASDGSAESVFGYAIALEGDRALISAFVSDTVAIDAGAVYAFEYSGGAWNETQLFFTPTPAAEGRFGSALAISGDRALVGNRDEYAEVYSYNGAEWEFEQRLEPSDPGGTTYFGFTVDLEGDRALVGRRFVSGGGAAYLFAPDGGQWVEQRSLRATDRMVGDSLGASLAIDGDTVVAGAPRVGTDAGAVYFFDLTEFPRGDANGDGTTEFLSDAVFLLNAAFVAGSPPPSCAAAADVNADGESGDVSDVVYLLAAGFIPGAPPIPAPSMGCGFPVGLDGDLGCELVSCP